MTDAEVVAIAVGIPLLFAVICEAPRAIEAMKKRKALVAQRSERSPYKRHIGVRVPARAPKERKRK